LKANAKTFSTETFIERFLDIVASFDGVPR
jgi:hypothetical protein